MPRERLNPAVLTDSYKASHFLQYPTAQLMVAYAEFRAPFDHDATDQRFVFYGLRYIIEEVISERWTEADVAAAERFFATHNAGHTPFAFPRDLFLAFIREYGGYFPVRIEALPEGTVAHPHVPVFLIFARHKYARLVTFLETLLTHCWYGSTVATLSRRTKDVIARAFELTVDDSVQGLLQSRLHDFGFRACTSVEQSIVGGCAHLLSFDGSDTLSAAYYAQMHLNDGRPVAQSIPASEHSVMTAWPSEEQATRAMIDAFGGEGRLFSVVFDSYNYTRALNALLPSVAQQLLDKGGMLIIRPDSGDPCECVLQALRACEAVLGADVNAKGFKVLRHLGVIQGDGLSYAVIKRISQAVMDAGFSAQCVAYGMGGGLLQRVNRDTLSFATKLSFLIDEHGHQRLVSKHPKEDGVKISLPGILRVIRPTPTSPLTVTTAEWDEARGVSVGEGESAMRTVWNCGPVEGCWDDFDTVRARVEREWHQTPKVHDVLSPALRERIAQTVSAMKAQQESEDKQRAAQPTSSPRVRAVDLSHDAAEQKARSSHQ